ncbi:uncharacterized protein LOC144494673 [Mustelus asterias]
MLDNQIDITMMLDFNSLAVAQLSVSMQTGCSVQIMSVRGEGGKGLSKGRGKRHHKVLHGNIQDIIKAIRPLARHGEVKHISRLIYEELRMALKVFLETIIRDSVTYKAEREMVTAIDVVYALKRQAWTMCGFGG